MIRVMHCREIARLLDSEAVAKMSWVDRVQVRVHLWTCWHCRLLVRQIAWLGNVARQHLPVQADDGLESRILKRLL